MIYRKTSNTSRVSNTSRGFRAFVQIEAGSLIEAGSPIQAGLEMGVDEIDESEDENNEVLIDADGAD